MLISDNEIAFLFWLPETIGRVFSAKILCIENANGIFVSTLWADVEFSRMLPTIFRY